MNFAVVGGLFLGIGAVTFLAGYIAERYHSRSFENHVSNLQEAEPDHELISAEIRRFHDDKRVFWSIRIIEMGTMGGIILIGVGITILLGTT